MEKRLLRWLAVFAASALLVAPTAASDKSEMEKGGDKMSKMTQKEGTPFKWARHADDILGSTIISPDNKELGTAEDLVIGKDGRIQYVILSSGGFIGIGEEEYTIPWKSIHIGKNVNTLVADISQESIQKFTDARKRSDAEEGKYAKQSSSDETQKDQRKMAESGKQGTEEEKSTKKLSEMEPEKVKDWLGKEVLSKNEKTLGTLENFYISQEGEIVYMIVKPQDRKGMRPIPTRLFRRSEKKDKLIARIDEKTFQEAPSFQKSDRPELSRSKWENKVRGYYMEAEQKSE